MQSQNDKALPQGIKWKEIEKLIENRYKNQILGLNNETLERVRNDHTTALKYAMNGVEKMSPENINEEYISAMVDVMQKVAQKVLEERLKK